MNISSTTRSTTLFLQRQSPAWWTMAGASTAAVVTASCMWLGGGAGSTDGMARESGVRPLFAGWVKPGAGDFGKVSRAFPSEQPKWVLATEPSDQEVQALQTALADHPDKGNELTRLVDFSRFQKQVALWSELQNGPMNSERSTLGEHLLEVLPEHYNRGELMGPQALLMAKALIKDIEPNPKRQDARLAEARTRLQHVAPAVPASEILAHQAFDKFKLQQEQIVSENVGGPELEARLDAARRSLLDAAPPGAGVVTHP